MYSPDFFKTDISTSGKPNSLGAAALSAISPTDSPMRLAEQAQTVLNNTNFTNPTERAEVQAKINALQNSAFTMGK